MGERNTRGILHNRLAIHPYDQINQMVDNLKSHVQFVEDYKFLSWIGRYILTISFYLGVVLDEVPWQPKFKIGKLRFVTFLAWNLRLVF